MSDMIFTNSLDISTALFFLDKYQIRYEYLGKKDCLIKGVSSLDQTQHSMLAFYRGEIIEQLSVVKSGSIVIIRKDLKNSIIKGAFSNINIILVEQPDLAFVIIAKQFKQHSLSQISKTAIIDKRAKIGRRCTIGHGVIIGSDVSLGDDVIIKEAAVLNNCMIGNNALIQSGVKVGSDGLGSIQDNTNRWHHFPHFGKVIIKDNVTILDNAVIARGVLTDTVIDNGAVIGTLTSIAHGVYIGENAFVNQSVYIAGLAVIKSNAKIWGNSIIRDGVTIGRNSVIGAGSVVLKSIPKDSVAYGNPAKVKL